jgi:thiamine biosynthesis lipoprotein
LFIAGPLHWRATAQRLGLNEVMLIDANRNVEMTPAMQGRIAAGKTAETAKRPRTR